MRLLKLVATRRRHRRYAVVAMASVVVVAAFGVSFVAAQESRNFIPWFTLTNGGNSASNDDTIMRTSLGQAAMGRSTSDEFEVILGFHTGVLAGAPAFAARVRELALTPLPTPTSTPLPTATPEPTEVPSETAEPVEDTPTPEAPVEGESPTPTPTPEGRPISGPSSTPTSTPAVPETPTVSPTVTPVVIVVTSVPEPVTEPEATATPYIIVVTAPPSDIPTPQPPSGGVCGLPVNNGSAPLDLGMLMLLVTPFMLWRFGFRP